MSVKDILLDDDFDLKIVDGDFVIDDATTQNEQLLLLLTKGELKQYPVDTVGIVTYVDDESRSALIQEIERQFTADGMQVNKVALEAGIVKTEAFYK